MKILVVEDNKKLASFLLRALTEEGYVVDVVGDGLTAVEQAQALAYELVILDWMLPEMDGLSVCRALRAKGSRVPILMLTARAEVPERIAGLDAGADDYLSKPFDLGELRSSAGIAVQWLSPMGLFRLSYAVPLRWQDATRRQYGDDIEEIQFSVGTAF